MPSTMPKEDCWLYLYFFVTDGQNMHNALKFEAKLTSIYQGNTRRLEVNILHTVNRHTASVTYITHAYSYLHSTPTSTNNTSTL